MKNKHIYKKLKLAIVLNAMYWYNSSEHIAYNHLGALKRVSEALAPDFYDIDMYQLLDYYNHVEGEIESLHECWFANQYHVSDYAQAHNIKLYSRKQLCL